MIGIRHSAALVLTLTLATMPAVAADEPHELIPGDSALIRYGVLAKFISRAPTTFDLPGGDNSPIAEGGVLSIFDTGSAESDTYVLPAGPKWTGLGNPPGSMGYKYRGSGSLTDPCRVVLVKSNIVKAVCKGRGVELITPFIGDAGVVLAIGTDTKRYCTRLGGTTLRNDQALFKAKSAPAPVTCPTVGSETSTTTSSTVIGSSTTTSTIGGPCCGGFSHSSFISDGFTGQTCGTVRSANGSEYAPIGCGGLYVGGGQNSITLPLATPDFLHWVVELTSCTGQTATVGPTTSTETGSRRNCTDTGCFFGGPLTIPNASSTPTSACVIITVATPASGSMNCGTGTGDIDLPLDAGIFLTGDSLPGVPGIQPCPLCNGGAPGVANSGTCQGGTNDMGVCTPGNSMQGPSYPTSHDCPPQPSLDIGTIPIGLALDSGTVNWVGTPAPNPSSAGQTRVFCGYCRDPESAGFKNPFQQCWQNGPFGPACTAPFDSCQQRSVGAFGPNGGGVKTITAVGIPAGPIVDGLGHDQTLASVFCIPPTFTPTVDAGADLGGPAAAALHGIRTLCSSANPCP
jgi:hypothetical protein